MRFLQAITKGFFSDFPPAVKEAADAIVNSRLVLLCIIIN